VGGSVASQTQLTGRGRDEWACASAGGGAVAVATDAGFEISFGGRGGGGGSVPGDIVAGMGLHTSTCQLNLSRF